jgi:hypothetical protein
MFPRGTPAASQFLDRAMSQLIREGGIPKQLVQDREQGRTASAWMERRSLLAGDSADGQDMGVPHRLQAGSEK